MASGAHQLAQGDLQISLIHAGSCRSGDQQDVEAWLDLPIERAQDRAQATPNAVANDGIPDLASG